VKEKIGFAGMGIMGCTMALNLLKAGYPLMVYNRSPDKKNLLLRRALSARPTRLILHCGLM